MPRDIRLIGLDLDNTTLNTKKQITPRVADTIRRAIEAGIVVLPATGRPLAGVTPQFLGIPGVRYALCSNGAKVYDLADGKKVVYRDCFANSEGLDVVKRALGYDAIAAVYLDGAAYSQPIDYDRLDASYSPGILEYFRSTRHEVPDLLGKIREAGGEVEKLSLSFTDPDERKRAMADFMADGRLAVTWSLGMNLELNTATANKGAALLALGRLLGIPREGVMAVGDSTNDLEMLKAAGYSVAMGDAMPELLQAADSVTLTADEDGVAAAIEAVMP